MANIYSSENITLVWFDPTVDIFDENVKMQHELRNILPDIHNFADVEKCLNYILTLSNNKSAILIVSGQYGEKLLSEIHELPSILSIYVYCIDYNKAFAWAKNFKKVQDIITDSNKLVVTIQDSLANVAKMENLLSVEVDTTKFKSALQHTLKDLVNAGELKYLEKNIREIAMAMVKKCKDEPTTDFESLILTAMEPMMYLLKREQNLVDFCGPFKSALAKVPSIPRVSQRMLIDKMMLKCDWFLCRRLTSLLSKRNPVPIVQPPNDPKDNNYRFMPAIIDVWDCHRPILLSFGIDNCEGKTPLINALFESHFEYSVKDQYFCGTIDIDFGYHFVERRSINIADVHGEISSKILAHISKLFNGFLVHVKSKSLLSHVSHIIDVLRTLLPKSYILLLIRDLDDEDDEEIKKVQQDIMSACPNCTFYTLPNVTDKSSEENKEKIDQLREIIFDGASRLTRHDPTYVKNQLEQLMDDTQRSYGQEDKLFLDHIRPILIHWHNDNYPLYTLFKIMCNLKLKIATIDPYQEKSDEELHNLRNTLIEITEKFRKKQYSGQSENGQGFRTFMELLQMKHECLKNLNRLSFELKHIKNQDQHSENSASIIPLEIHWRNAIIESACLSNSMQQTLIDAYTDYIKDGNPFEIVDGDNFDMHGKFLKKVFTLFGHKKIFVISIIGPQNSGKSTLLNFLFGTLFEVREERCTKGIYGTLLDVQSRKLKHNLLSLNYDYILVIDTEGLLSIEKGDTQYDKRLILFCLAVSHLVIVNVSGEINEILKRTLLLCTQSLQYLDKTLVKQPTVHFVLNQRADPNKKNAEKQMAIVRQDLEKHGLNNLIDLKAENFHVLSTAFNRKPFMDSNGNCAALLTDIKFVTNVQSLCKTLIDSSSSIINRAGDGFSVSAEWIGFAYSILKIIKQHPDLTFFQDIFERTQYDKAKEHIRSDFQQYLTPEFVVKLIKAEENSSQDRIKDSFMLKQNEILGMLERRLETYLNEHGVNENVRERAKNFLKAQVISLFRSWEVSAIISAERNKVQNKVKQAENELRHFALTKISSNSSLDKDIAIREYDQMWDDRFTRVEKSFDWKMQWNQAISLVYRLYDVLSTEALSSLDDVLNYASCVNTLSTSSQPTLNDKTLAEISDECRSKWAAVCPLSSHVENAEFKLDPYSLRNSFEFLDFTRLKNKYFESEKSDFSRNRAVVRKGPDQYFSEEIMNNWDEIFQLSHCFDKLIESIKPILMSQSCDESSNEIALLQKVLGVVNDLIQDVNAELKNFHLHLFKAFQGVLHIIAILLVTLFYSDRQRNHFNEVLRTMEHNKTTLRDRFVRMVVPQDNKDEDIVQNLIQEIDKRLFQLFSSKIEETFSKIFKKELSKLNRRSIIELLNKEVYTADDQWLMDYILKPLKVITDRFDRLWDDLVASIVERLQNDTKEYLTVFQEFFGVTNMIHGVLQEKGANIYTFDEELFHLPSDIGNSNAADKKICMASLLQQYFTKKPSHTSITLKSGATYTVSSKWQEIIQRLPTPSKPLVDIFCSMEAIFETYSITHLSTFLEKVLQCQAKAVEDLKKKLNDSINELCQRKRDKALTRLKECEKLCPCCKRLCDADHRLDTASPVGEGENRHCCQTGHQIRGMAGIKYERTNEASIQRCENIKDTDPIVTSGNQRETWKDFKDKHRKWDFGDPSNIDDEGTPYFHIWKRIGKQLCQQHANQMKFVLKNSPQPANHFILIFDHSSSMNTHGFVDWVLRSLGRVDSSVLTPWEHLLEAVKVFTSIRKQKACSNDRMSTIVFGTQALRVQYLEELGKINVDKISESDCGSDTNFSAAFQELIKILANVQRDSRQQHLRHTIIFMTDGEPQQYPAEELKRLSTEYKSMITNFWTMRLRKYNKTILEMLNTTMNGKIVDIENVEDLVEVYAEIAFFNCDS